MLTADDKAAKRLWNSRALINACKPFDRLTSFAPVADASPALTKANKQKICMAVQVTMSCFEPDVA